MASVTLEAVTKRFGTFTAVKAMDLDVRDGEFVAILGPSGCGKTTTMNMIAGIESVSAGTIRFDERDVTAVPMSRRGVGFVFQNYAIFTHMSVRKNLAFGLEIRRLPAEEIRRRVEDMADFMSLTPPARRAVRGPLGERAAEARDRPLGHRGAADLPARRAAVESRRGVS